MKPLKLLFLLSVLALVAASATAAFGQSAHVAASRATVTTKSTSLGTILVTSSGKTLYLDAGDKPPHFACTGGCLAAWPPLTSSGKPKAAGKVKASMLGIVKNGKFTQVTYNGHPLYTFVSDTSAKPTSGEGVHGFYAVSASGAKVTSAPTTTTTTTTTTTSSSTSTSAYGY
jgi:predicted lipoprotein with Yx(FWY)xxD motif